MSAGNKCVREEGGRSCRSPSQHSHTTPLHLVCCGVESLLRHALLYVLVATDYAVPLVCLVTDDAASA